MERKIGEIFEYNGEWYQCVEQPKNCIGEVCEICAFHSIENCEIDMCSGTYRSDKTSVIFKKLEKVGKPYRYQGMGIIMVQEYILANANYIWEYSQDVVVMDCQNGKVAIEIKTKQNKEDMEEKKLNLKPFDLEAAKAGKPVCTRDGKKARIVCFDAKGECPLIALITFNNGAEYIKRYTVGGRYYGISESNSNLMILPEKKEGWVNVYPADCMGQKRYSTKEEALSHANSDVIDTVKIVWEE